MTSRTNELASIAVKRSARNTPSRSPSLRRKSIHSRGSRTHSSSAGVSTYGTSSARYGTGSGFRSHARQSMRKRLGQRRARATAGPRRKKRKVEAKRVRSGALEESSRGASLSLRYVSDAPGVPLHFFEGVAS